MSADRLSAESVATPVPANTVAEPSASASSDLVADLWGRIRAELARLDPAVAGGLDPWLDRLEPGTLREGRLELITRSPRAAPLLRARVVPLVEQIARRVLGTPIRLVIEVDHSLGGALHSLGLKPAAFMARPAAFVSRPETRLAHTALMRLAREPQPEFEQVVLEGPVGVGKSLLLSTFLWHRRRRFPRERWRLERAERFFRDFTAACRDQSRATFRGERVACDGLLLDDAHELSGKLVCQETLVEMLEYFRARGRPVLVAMEPLHGGPRDFLPALRSLLRRGLRITIPQLSATSRGEILAERARTSIPAGAAAPASTGWIGELAAATELPLASCVDGLAAAGALARRLGRAPRRDELEGELPELLPRIGRAEPFDRVLDRCAEFVGISRDSLVSGARTRGAALGRHLAVYLALEVFRLQRATVRRWLGTLSPSVLPYAKAKVEALRAKDRRLDGFLREVAEEIGRGQRFLFA